MAIIESCCGCSLATSSAVLGVYLLVAYAIAFAIELWWILETTVARPIPAYLLCFGYFILLTFSGLLLQGLSLKRTTFLLIWLFMMGILLGPEAGLVLYLSIHYWRVTSMYGIIEVTCWGCRLVVNTISLLCVQSLHSIWREENSVLLRLETLKKQSSSTKDEERKLSVSSFFRGHKNRCFEERNTGWKVAQEKGVGVCQGRFGFPRTDENYEDDDGSFIDEHYSKGNKFSEFSASSFDPTVIDAKLESMPYLTIRGPPKRSHRTPVTKFSEPEKLQKTRSLLDFRHGEFTDVERSNNYNNSLKAESKTESLDRKIIKNKNLKILKTLSPFNNKKAVEVNIYQINPPKDLTISDLDCRLNQVYCNRGMYVFDEKIKKVVFYPPELFESMKFRKRKDSYGSSQSRSSVDTDSEDIRHISDVAL